MGWLLAAGRLYPELNFTLPNMTVTPESMAEVRSQYTQMITEACARAVELHAPGLVSSSSCCPTDLQPEWGAE